MSAIDALSVAADGEYRVPVARVGVYVLIKNDVAVYVGSSRNIEGRVGTHAGSGVDFDRVIWFGVQWSRALRFEGALIRALRPTLNTSAPAYHGGDNAILASLGLSVHADEAENARPWQEARAAVQRAGYFRMSKKERKRIAASVGRAGAATRAAKKNATKAGRKTAPAHQPSNTSDRSTQQDISTHCANRLSAGAMLVGGGL